jgi:pimeloyl-ACP methyl ester carboxylesterase
VRVRVGDVRLFFDVEGMSLVPDGSELRERPTVLLLHGGPGFDHSVFKPTFARLAEIAQLVFLDHRGQGRSDASSPDRWNLDTWIEDVKGFCDVLELERPVIVGQSFGGIVALGVASRYPHLPAKLIVSSSIGRFRPDRALPMFERIGGREARDVAAAFFAEPSVERWDVFMATCLPLYNPRPIRPEVLARVRFRPEVGVHFFAGEALRYDLLGEVGRISCPTLILAGELDPITTVADHEDLTSAIPGSRLEVFADAGHGVYRDKPDEALALIRDFVAPS